jgi:outer membrane protein W
MKYIILSAITLLCGINLYSQGSFIMSYPISFPMGNLHDYISKTSWRGINLEFLKHAKPGVAVGLETGWNVFYERVDKQPYKDGTTTITGVTYRYTNAVPILVESKWYPTKETKTTNPYVGLGVGTLFVSRSTDFGLYRITTDSWQFCVRPEAGVLFSIEPGLKAMLGAKYYPGFNTDKLDGQGFLSINVGFVFSSL